MKIAKIKTIFHIVGAAFLIFGSIFILIAIDDGGTQSTIALAIGLLLVAVAIYCLAGAPHITKALKRKFPSDGPQKRAASNPRHKLKANVGIYTGIMMGIIPLLIVLFDLFPARSRESLGDIFLLVMFFAPALSTWGAAHLAWDRGHSPMIPILVGVFCFVCACIMGALQNTSLVLAGYILITVSPVLAVTLLKRRSRRARG